MSAAVVLTGCENNSHEDSFGAVENVEYSEDDKRDEEADPKDDMAASQESEVLNDSEKPDIENDTDLSAMEIYERWNSMFSTGRNSSQGRPETRWNGQTEGLLSSESL